MPKTITDIIPPSRRRAMAEQGNEPHGMSDMVAPPPPPPPQRPWTGSEPSNKKRFPIGFVIAAVVVVLASVGILFAFGGAKVEATPVVKEVNVSGSYSATPSSGDLPYEVISVEKLAGKEVEAEGTETANIPSQGTVTIYNAQTKAQELIKNTRFETSEGLIFRIRDSVRVPAGTAEKPGELTATVYADAGGDAYNVGPTTFTLPGLASSAAYDLVYAKSVEPMKGGFTGTRPSLSDVTRLSEYESMHAPLETELRTAITEQVPDGYVLLNGATFVTFTPEPDGQAPSDSVGLSLKGTAHAFVFPAEALARVVAFNTLGVYTGQPVTLRASDGLTFTSEAGTPAPGIETLPFTLSGTTDIVWLVDADEIKGAIAGKSRDAAKTILAGFSELEEARLVLKPFWAGTLPADPSEIKVEVTVPPLGK